MLRASRSAATGAVDGRSCGWRLASTFGGKPDPLRTAASSLRLGSGCCGCCDGAAVWINESSPAHTTLTGLLSPCITGAPDACEGEVRARCIFESSAASSRRHSSFDRAFSRTTKPARSKMNCCSGSMLPTTSAARRRFGRGQGRSSYGQLCSRHDATLRWRCRQWGGCRHRARVSCSGFAGAGRPSIISGFSLDL